MTQKYKDWKDEDTFVISGHLEGEFPVDPATGQEIKPRVISKLRFPTIAEALAYLTGKYGRVYEDLSNEELGIWAGRVGKPGRLP